MFLEIELLPNLGEEKYLPIIQELTKFLTTEGSKFVSSRVREHSASIRPNVKPQTVKTISKGVDSVWEARKAPKAQLGKPQSLPVSEDIKPGLPQPNIRPICVLDTGVDRNHPFLRGLIIDAVDLTIDGQEQDENGHGTFVAGLAAYGNFENQTDPIPSAKIISAKVLGKNPVKSPYLETRLEEAVNRFSKITKIFSLSIIYSMCSKFSQPSELAYTIDNISREKNVLFVICTGNLESELGKLRSLPYPMYFGDKSCIVYNGAEASNCITVGGLANKRSSRCEADINQPSPFTRRGDLVDRGKPDVIYWAGNAERNKTTGLLHSNPRLGILSLGLNSSLLAYDSGTSYAAPLIANLLVKLQNEYPTASPNLLKALLIHFSQLPEENQRLNLSGSLRNAIFGKGVPDFYRCAYSTKSCATFILEDSINFDEIAFIPLYIFLEL